jgi:hypothetical protein
MKENNRWIDVDKTTIDNLYKIANSVPTKDESFKNIERLIQQTHSRINENYSGQKLIQLRAELLCAQLCYDHQRSDIGLGFKFKNKP